MSDTATEVEQLRTLWDQRESDPIQAAEAIANRFHTQGLSPYRLSLEVGGGAAEVSVYLDLAELEPSVRDKIISKNLPLSLATDLIKEDPEQQRELIELLLEAEEDTEDTLALFEKVAQEYYDERGVNASTVSGPALMHLGGKATHYNALSGKRRSAIVGIGKDKMMGGYSNLSTKQIRYVNDILDELEDEDILTAACHNTPDGDCEHCEAVRELVETG